MNGGVTVILCIVGALGLCEAILPRVFAALCRWRQERARAATNRTVAVSATGVVTGDPLANAGRGGRDGTDLTVSGRGGRDGTDLTVSGRGARAEKERQIPGASDLHSDYEDLGNIYEAAKQGRPEARVELGDYAYSRGAIVEAFYWTILAELKGADGLDETLFEMRTRWLSEGCPPEFENAYSDFTEEQGEFARAVLCLQCDVDPQYASIRLDELADAGNEDARLFVQVAKEEVER